MSFLPSVETRTNLSIVQAILFSWAGRNSPALIIVLLLIVSGWTFADEVITRNFAWTLEGGNRPIVQITNESRQRKTIKFRILIRESSYRYPPTFEVPPGENRFLALHEILDRIAVRHEEIKKETSGILQLEFEGEDRELKSRIVNLNPRGITTDRESEMGLAPIIEMIEPNTGSTEGGTVVRLIGENFRESTSVRFGGIPAMRSLQSPEILIAITPPHQAETVDIEVRTGKQRARLQKVFTYESEAPVIHRVVPDRGSSKGGFRIIIEGRSFRSDATVRWNEKPVSAQLQNPEQLTLIAPAGTRGPVSVEVINPGDKNFLLEEAFVYKGSPEVHAITPSMGSPKGGYLITVTGEDFEQGSSILMGSRYIQTTFINPSALAGRVPSGESGYVDIIISNPDGETSTASRAFLFNEPPRILSITASPNPIIRLTNSTITVDAIDPEADALAYEYSLARSPGGSVSGQGGEATFRSSNMVGKAIIRVTVYDSHRAKSEGLVEIKVE